MNPVTANKPRKLRIGDLLVEHKIITPDQLTAALAAQKQSGQKIGRVLIANGYITEDALLTFLARQLRIEYIDLKKHEFDLASVRAIPEIQARRFRAICLENGPTAYIGMADPADIFAYDEIARLLNKPLRLAVVREADLLSIIDKIYASSSQLADLATELGEQITAEEHRLPQALPDSGNDAPVVKLLQTLLGDAVRAHASDIHIEPEQKELRIRFRIDGVLRIHTTVERRIAGALISRLKLIAHMDISERRLPQDGRFNIHVRDKSIDVRVSTLPQQNGEGAVLRILDQTSENLHLERLGMSAAFLERFRRLIHSTYGIVLVTGPTGSGKTTTLYSALQEINTPAVKIITVEDPVEYRLAGVNQVQVNPKIDLTFARVLRTILRQDPDIVLIGEMRDQETVEIGLRTAMTGHLVFSTLHTNDATSTILRLVDMGAEPYLIASAVRGILAQRLVRHICTECAVSEPLHESVVRLLERECNTTLTTHQFKKSSGCAHCNNTGYRGRIGIHELLEIHGELAVAIQEQAWTRFNELAVQQPGYQSLKVSALQLALEGKTSIAEVLRVAFGIEG